MAAGGSAHSKLAAGEAAAGRDLWGFWAASSVRLRQNRTEFSQQHYVRIVILTNDKNQAQEGGSIFSGA